jgi:hypothetical protein
VIHEIILNIISINSISFPSPPQVVPIPRGKGGDASKTVHRTYAGKSLSEVESEAKDNLPKGDWQTQVPVTLYSQNIGNFGLSAANGSNPFCRSTTFTNDISDTTKVLLPI